MIIEGINFNDIIWAYVTTGADDLEMGVHMHTLRNVIASITSKDPRNARVIQNLLPKHNFGCNYYYYFSLYKDVLFPTSTTCMSQN